VTRASDSADFRDEGKMLDGKQNYETGKPPVLPPSELPAKGEWEEVASGIS
jgi:hypothetical protein